MYYEKEFMSAGMKPYIDRANAESGADITKTIDKVTSEDIKYPQAVDEIPVFDDDVSKDTSDIPKEDRDNPFFQDAMPKEDMDNPFFVSDASKADSPEPKASTTVDTSDDIFNPFFQDVPTQTKDKGPTYWNDPELLEQSIDPTAVLTGEVWNLPDKPNTGGGGGWKENYLREGVTSYAHEDLLRAGEAFVDYIGSETPAATGGWDWATRVLPTSVLKTVGGVSDFFLHQAPKSLMIGTFAMIDKMANVFEVDIGQAGQGGGGTMRGEYFEAADIGFYDDADFADPTYRAITQELAMHSEGLVNVALKPFGAEMSLGVQDGQEAYFQRPSLERAWHNWKSDPAGCALGLVLLSAKSKTARKKMRQVIAKSLRSGEQPFKGTGTPGNMPDGGLAGALLERGFDREQMRQHSAKSNMEMILEAEEAMTDFTAGPLYNVYGGEFADTGKVADLHKEPVTLKVVDPAEVHTERFQRTGSELNKIGEKVHKKLAGEPQMVSQKFQLIKDGIVEGTASIVKTGDRAFIDSIEGKGLDLRALRNQYLRENPEIAVLEGLRVKKGVKERPVEFNVAKKAKSIGVEFTKGELNEVTKEVTKRSETAKTAETIMTGKETKGVKLHSGAEWEFLFKQATKAVDKVAAQIRNRTKFFNTETTGMPMYDDIMTDPGYHASAKKRQARIVDMTPREYLEAVGEQQNLPPNKWLDPESRKRAMHYAKRMREGEKAPMPVLDLKSKGQEGRHRAYAAELAGAKTIPVLVVEDVGVKSKYGVNASGESVASLEALNWVESMKKQGSKIFKIDMKKGTKVEIPMSVEARESLSRPVGPNEMLVQTKVGKGGAPAILQQGDNVNTIRANNYIGLNKLGSNIIPVDALGTLATKMWDGIKTKRDFLADIFDVEDKYTRIGGPKTGFFVKIKPSVEAMFETQGLVHVKKWAMDARKTLFGDKKVLSRAQRAEMEDIFFQATIMAESEKALYEGTGLVKRIALELRNSMDTAQQVLESRGLRYDFKERMRQDLERAREVSTTVAEKFAIENALRNLEDYQFVHLPVGMLMEKWMQDPGSQGKTIRLLNSKKRKTPTIKELYESRLGKRNEISKSDLGAHNVMASYYRRLGRDIALQDILNAAQEEGLMKYGGYETGMVRMRGYEAPQLAKAWFHPAFSDMLKNIYVNKDFPTSATGKALAAFDRTVNMTKMLAFYNPIFLPMYDVVQGAMVFGERFYQMPKYIAKGGVDVFRKTPEYWEAQALGISSKPFGNSMETYKGMLDRTMRTPLEIMHESARTQLSRMKNAKGFERLPILPEIYNASWYLAWELDAAVRMGTYRFLKDRGKAPKEAAQLAALFHGDYASVPQETRRMLNRFFFTPTFKIAMAKTYKKMMTDALRGTQGWEFGTAKGLAMAAAIQLATDTLMTKGLGFEQDQFGRRYVKKVNNQEGIDRELVIVFSNPANMWTKYLSRMYQSYHTPHPFRAFASMNMTEVTPLTRTAIEVATGQSMTTGEMYNWRLDTLGYCLKKAVPYSVNSLVRVTKHLPGMKTIREDEVAYLKNQEFNKLSSGILDMISFAYARDTKNKRIWYQYQREYRDFMSYVKKRTREGEPYSEARVKNFQKNMDALIKQLD